VSRLVPAKVLEIQEKILKCQKTHGYFSCSQCYMRLFCRLFDEWISCRRLTDERGGDEK